MPPFPVGVSCSTSPPSSTVAEDEDEEEDEEPEAAPGLAELADLSREGAPAAVPILPPPRVRGGLPAAGGGEGGGERRRVGAGKVVVLPASGSGHAAPRSHRMAGMVDEAAAGTLPINLHLPRIASLHHRGKGKYGRRAMYDHGGDVPKPSVIPPGGRDGDAPIEQTQWKELARSYGLHLLPDSGQLLLQDNLGSAFSAPPPPPDVYGRSIFPPGNLSAQPIHQSPHPSRDPLAVHHRKSTSILDSSRAVGPDLSASPSLPMLSPGRPGARNWVTFLHGLT